MPIRSLGPAALLAGAFCLSLAVSTTGAKAYDCQEQVSRQLQDHGVSQSTVQSVKLMRRTFGGKAGGDRYDAWVRLQSCTNGALVVQMTGYCMVQDVYTTGDCRVGDLPNY